jgi:DNA modification methylase
MSDITWTNITVRLGDLKPWQDNPRHSTKAQAKRILASFERFGQVAPIAVSPALEVYDGHQRLSALLTVHGPDYMVEARQSSRALTDDERRGLVLALANATGSWDWDRLSAWEAEDLKDWGMDALTLSGWQEDVKNLKEFLQSEKPSADAEPQTDRAAELLEKWQVTPGSLWQIGEHRLICGDCTDAAVVARVMDGEKADFSVTDPPYNVKVLENNDDMPEDEFIAWCKLWAEFMPPSFVLTVGIRNLLLWDSILGRPQWIISWVKRNGQGLTALGGTNKWDAVLCYGVKRDGGTDVIEINNDYSEGIKSEGGHLTAKPPELWSKLLERFGDETVYEPFSGSGTTLVACENLRRRCRAIEISPAYVAVALERMATAFPELPIVRLESQ